MTVQVTLSFTNAAEAATFLASIGQARAAVAPAPATAAEASDRLFGSANNPAAPVLAAPAPAAAAPVLAAPAPAAAAPVPAAAARVFDYDKDVLPSLVALSKVMDRANFAGTLARFGVSKVPELKLKPDCWKEVTEYAEGFVANAQKQAA